MAEATPSYHERTMSSETKHPNGREIACLPTGGQHYRRHSRSLSAFWARFLFFAVSRVAKTWCEINGSSRADALSDQSFNSYISPTFRVFSWTQEGIIFHEIGWRVFSAPEEPHRRALGLRSQARTIRSAMGFHSSKTSR